MGAASIPNHFARQYTCTLAIDVPTSAPSTYTRTLVPSGDHQICLMTPGSCRAKCEVLPKPEARLHETMCRSCEPCSVAQGKASQRLLGEKAMGGASGSGSSCRGSLASCLPEEALCSCTTWLSSDESSTTRSQRKASGKAERGGISNIRCKVGRSWAGTGGEVASEEEGVRAQLTSNIGKFWYGHMHGEHNLGFNCTGGDKQYRMKQSWGELVLGTSFSAESQPGPAAD